MAQLNLAGDLHEDARNGNLIRVKRWLDRGTPVNARKEGYTALHRACQNGQIEIVKYLLERGADVHARTFGYYGPLHWAATGGYREIVEILLEAGSDPNAPLQNGKLAYQLAQEEGHTELSQFLLERCSKSTKSEDTFVHERLRQQATGMLATASAPITVIPPLATMSDPPPRLNLNPLSQTSPGTSSESSLSVHAWQPTSPRSPRSPRNYQRSQTPNPTSPRRLETMNQHSQSSENLLVTQRNTPNLERADTNIELGYSRANPVPDQLFHEKAVINLVHPEGSSPVKANTDPKISKKNTNPSLFPFFLWKKKTK